MESASLERAHAAAPTGPLRRVRTLTSGLTEALAWVVRRFTLFKQFALLSLLILVVGAYIIGSYVSGEIKERVISRTSAITALYVESFLSPHLQELNASHQISPDHFARLDELLTGSSLGQKIVAFKIWHTDGQVVYANESSLVGRTFPIGGGLSEALSGQIHTAMSDLKDAENLYERERWGRLLETYAPVHEHNSGRVIAVSEFYQDPSEMEAEVASSQRKGWFIVGGSTTVMYLLLVGMVAGASNTIRRQHRRLEDLARRNAGLAERVRRAASRKTETDERLLKRVAQDLHDGPAQDISLALLRLEHSFERGPAKPAELRDSELTRTALNGALRQIRQICAGLRLPDLEELSIDQAVERAVAEHVEKTGSNVQLMIGTGLPPGDLPRRIAMYRVTQEALNNAYLHGGSAFEEVKVVVDGGDFCLEVRDHGVGIAAADDTRHEHRSHLGIRGMRERVEMLGGTLTVSRHPESGTLLRATLPLNQRE